MSKNEILTDTRFILKQDHNLPSCIICDIDGTIALMNGRHPYDDKLVYTDKVNEQVKRILSLYNTLGIEIIYLSGRSESTRTVTRQWLFDNGLWYAKGGCQRLYMRKEGDYRQDAIIKKELYEEHIKDNYYVEFILDDRNQVVNMWRLEGLLCLQVYYGDF